MNPRTHCVAPLALAVLLSALAGCPLQLPDELNIETNNSDDVAIDAPAEFSQADFVLTPDATIVTDVAAIPLDVIPDISVLTFENFTDYDLAISYYIEDIPETVLVLSGETVSIQYDPCLADVQLDYEDDFDPISGLYAGSFDLSDVALFEGTDFLCGDEIFFTFNPEAVSLTAQPL